MFQEPIQTDCANFSAELKLSELFCSRWPENLRRGHQSELYVDLFSDHFLL